MSGIEWIILILFCGALQFASQRHKMNITPLFCISGLKLSRLFRSVLIATILYILFLFSNVLCNDQIVMAEYKNEYVVIPSDITCPVM